MLTAVVPLTLVIAVDGLLQEQMFVESSPEAELV